MFTKENKVLFIIHDVYQEDNQFPLGPAYLAAVLHEKGASVEAFCMDIFHYTNEELAKHLQKNTYDIIGVGFLAARYTETIIDLCETINKNKKNAWFILGGACPSAIPEYILRNTYADITTIGEAENTIVDLLKCKINQANLSDVDGIAYLKNDEFIKTKKNRIEKKLDKIPFPLWEIFPMDKYTTCCKAYNQLPHEMSLGIITSRGCTNRCNFCQRLEKGLRLRSIDNVIEEIKILYQKYGVSCFWIHDELFIVNKKRIIDFGRALKESNIKIKFYCQARADIVDKELIEILKKCGCQFINIGFESSDDKVLKRMNKNVTVAQNIRALEVIKNVDGIGIRVPG